MTLKLPRIDFDLKLPRPPFWMVAGLVILIVASWLPLAMILKSRQLKSGKPRIHLIQDMDNQPRPESQGSTSLFADTRAMRRPVPGTVARGELHHDDHYELGYRLVEDETGKQRVDYYHHLPARIEIDDRLLERGREQYGVFCYPCHGMDGRGNGPVNVRATSLGEPSWIPPTDLHRIDQQAGLPQYGSELYPDGLLFNTITNGVRNMAAYGPQIDIDNRWAIVAYIRALQLSQFATIENVPLDKRGALK